jgi:hypothetical protein
VLSHFRELNHFLIVTVNSTILSVVLSHFAKVFSHLSLLSHFPPLEILSAIFPLLSNFLALEILLAIFHYLAILHTGGGSVAGSRAGGGSVTGKRRPEADHGSITATRGRAARAGHMGPSSVGRTPEGGGACGVVCRAGLA